jgi:amidase
MMSVAGPMARSVQDLRLALRIIAGPDGLDTHVPPVPWRDLERPKLGDLSIAWSSKLPGSDTQDEIRTVVEGVTDRLAEEGATVEQSMPDVNLEHQFELGEELSDLLGGTFPEEPTAFSEEASVASKGHDSLEAYLMAWDRRDNVMRAWEVFFADRDVLIVPAGTRTAERHGEGPTNHQRSIPMPSQPSQVAR